jgi:hypothetical protein
VLHGAKNVTRYFEGKGTSDLKTYGEINKNQRKAIPIKGRVRKNTEGFFCFIHAS